MRRALCEYANLFSGDKSCWISKTVKDSLPDITNDAFELDGLAFLAEIGAALVPGICGEEGPISGDDLKREKTQEIGDAHEGMKNPVVQGFAQAIFEIGECPLTWDKEITYAGVEPVMFPLYWISEDINKGFHVGILFDVAEKFQQEKADRVVGESGRGIGVGNDGSDKGEIYQGRYKSGKSADHPAVGMDFDVSALVSVLG
jgi:hypothetical protein